MQVGEIGILKKERKGLLLQYVKEEKMMGFPQQRDGQSADYPLTAPGSQPHSASISPQEMQNDDRSTSSSERGPKYTVWPSNS